MRIIALYLGGRRYVLRRLVCHPVAGEQSVSDAGALQDAASTRSPATLSGTRDRRPSSLCATRRRSPNDSRWFGRIAGEIEGYVVELGTDGRLLALQLEELMAGVEQRTRARRPRLHARRVDPPGRDGSPTCSRRFDELSQTDLLDLSSVATVLGYPAGAEALDVAVSPRGYRLLAKVPRIPGAVVEPVGSTQFGGPAEAARGEHRRISRWVEGVG